MYITNLIEKKINEDFDYRKELKSMFELSPFTVWDLIDDDQNNQHFWSIYSKENILDPYNEFDPETIEKAKNSSSQWFCLNWEFYEIGSDYDLQCYYDDYRSNNKKSVDDVKNERLNALIKWLQERKSETFTYTDRKEFSICIKRCNCETVGEYETYPESCDGNLYLVDINDGNSYLYQDWDQVYENIIYDLFPTELIKDFAQ